MAEDDDLNLEGEINLDIGPALLDVARLIEGMEKEFAEVSKRIQQILSKTLRSGTLRNDFSKIGKEFRDAGALINDSMRFSAKDVGGDIGEGMRRAAREAGAAADDVGDEFVQMGERIRSVFVKVELGFKDLADAIHDRSQATREYAESLKVLQRRAKENRDIDRAAIDVQREKDRQTRLAVTAETTARQRIAALDRKQLSDQQHFQSMIRIAEQASQQKRLASHQAFYKALGDMASRAGQEVASTFGSFTRGLGSTLNGALQSLLPPWRRHNDQVSAINRQGGEEQVSILRRMFGQRQSVIQSSLAKESAAQRAASQSQRGVIGLATGQSPLQGILPVAGGIGFSAALLKALNITSDFTSALAQLRVASSATDAQMERLRQKAVELGNDVTLPGVSAKDAADAFRILAISGINVEQILGGTGKAVLQLSRAAGVDGAEAAKSLAAGVNVFGIQGERSAKVADALAKSLSVSGSSLLELNDALAQSSLQFQATFKGAASGEENFADLNAALAIFAKNGLRGSDAGTSLKTALQALGGRSDVAKDALADLAKRAGVQGTVLFDATGKTRKFSEAIAVMSAGLKGLNEQQRADVIQKVFGGDASRAANVLLDNADAMGQLSSQITKTGFAAELAQAQNAGFKGGLDALQSTLETIGIAFGRKVEPFLRRVLVGFADLLNNLTQGRGVWAVARAGLLGIAGGLAAIVAAKGAVEVLGLLRIGVSGLRSPLGFAGIAIGGLGAAIGLLAQRSPEAREAFSRIGDAAQRFASGLADLAAPAIARLGDGIANLAERVLPLLERGLKSMADVLDGAVGPALEGIRKGAGTALDAATGALKDFLGGFAGADNAVGFFADLGDAARTGLQYVTAFASVVKDLLVQGFQGATGGGGLVGFIRGVGETARDVFNFVSRLGANLAGLFDTAGGGFGDRLKSVFAGLAPILNDLLGGIPGRIANFVQTEIVGPLRTFFKNIFDGRSLAAGVLILLNTIGQKLGRTVTAFLTDPTFLKVVAATLAAVAAAVVSTIAGVIQGVIEKLLERLKQMLERIPILGAFVTATENAIGVFKGFAKTVAGILTAALLAAFAFGKVAPFFQRISGAFRGAFDGARVGARLFVGDMEGADRVARRVQERAAQAAAAQSARQGLRVNFGAVGGTVAGLGGAFNDATNRFDTFIGKVRAGEGFIGKMGQRIRNLFRIDDIAPGTSPFVKIGADGDEAVKRTQAQSERIRRNLSDIGSKVGSDTGFRVFVAGMRETTVKTGEEADKINRRFQRFANVRIPDAPMRVFVAGLADTAVKTGAEAERINRQFQRVGNLRFPDAPTRVFVAGMRNVTNATDTAVTRISSKLVTLGNQRVAARGIEQYVRGMVDAGKVTESTARKMIASFNSVARASGAVGAQIPTTFSRQVGQLPAIATRSAGSVSRALSRIGQTAISTTALQRFSGALESMVTTVRARVRVMSDDLALPGRAAIEAGNRIRTGFSGAFTSVPGMMAGAAEAASRTATRIGDAFSSVGQKLRASVSGAIQAIGGIQGAIGGIQGALGLATIAVGAFALSYSQAMSHAASQTQQLTTLLGSVLTGAITGFAVAGPAGALIGALTGGIADAAGAAAGAQMEGIRQVQLLEGHIQRSKTAVEGATGSVEQFKSSLRGIAGSATFDVKRTAIIGLTDMIKAQAPAFEEISNLIPGFGKRLSSLFSGVASGSIDAQTAVSQLKSTLGTLSGRSFDVKTNLPPILQAGTYQEAQKAAKDFRDQIDAELAKGVIPDNFGLIPRIVQAGKDSFTVVASSMDGLTQGASAFVDQMIAALGVTGKEAEFIRGELGSAIRENNAELERGPSFLDLMKAKVSEQASLWDDLKRRVREALTPPGESVFTDLATAPDKVAEATERLGDAFKNVPNKAVPALDDMSKAARNQRGAIQELTSTFREQATALIASSDSVPVARERINSLLTVIQKVGTASGLPQKLIDDVKAMVNVPDSNLAQVVGNGLTQAEQVVNTRGPGLWTRWREQAEGAVVEAGTGIFGKLATAAKRALTGGTPEGGTAPVEVPPVKVPEIVIPPPPPVPIKVAPDLGSIAATQTQIGGAVVSLAFFIADQFAVVGPAFERTLQGMREGTDRTVGYIGTAFAGVGPVVEQGLAKIKAPAVFLTLVNAARVAGVGIVDAFLRATATGLVVIAGFVNVAKREFAKLVPAWVTVTFAILNATRLNTSLIAGLFRGMVATIVAALQSLTSGGAFTRIATEAAAAVSSVLALGGALRAIVFSVQTIGSAITALSTAIVAGIGAMFDKLRNKTGEALLIAQNNLNRIRNLNPLGLNLGSAVGAATGEVITRPSYRLVGEAGIEVIAPKNNIDRSVSLLDKAGMLDAIVERALSRRTRGGDSSTVAAPTTQAPATQAPGQTIVEFRQVNTFNGQGVDEEYLAMTQANRTRELLLSARF